MKIVFMRATFGCLDGAELELSGGTDRFVLANEGGKSTWAAFVTAMFYGLDPRRSAKGRLSDKERYMPWSGKPMEGLMELEVDGKHILLQRTSTAARPFGKLQAWDQDTGLLIADLTGENCGIRLLGVEREVFRRTAFLSGSELAVSMDHDLSRRLGSLAAAGRQEDSFTAADERLRSRLHRLRYRQSGAIVQAQQQLAELMQQQSAPETAHLPSEQALLRLLGALQQDDAPRMACPPALKDCAQILSQVQKDLSRRRMILIVLGAIAALSVVPGILISPWFFLLTAALAALFLVALVGRRLCRSYGVSRIKQILPAAVQWQQEEKRRWELDLVLEEVRDFAPDAHTAQQARSAIEQALRLHGQAQAAKPADPAQQARLRQTIQTLEREEQALLLARQALQLANEQLQQTYVPQLTKVAGAYLRELTLGRYDGLVMDEDMELSVTERGGLLRPLAALSRGTQDQTWLALRLAMTRLLLPEGAPVLLDDALLTFDRERETAALELLRREKRQVIVFSCR